MRLSPLQSALLAATAGLCFGTAQAQTASDDAWTGPYAGLGLGWQKSVNRFDANSVGPGNVFGVDPGNVTDSLNKSGARADLFLGYNYQIAPQIVLGGEVDIARDSNVKKTILGVPGVTYPGSSIDTLSAKRDYDASLRARIGYLPVPDLLVYGTGGVALQDYNLSANCPGNGDPNTYCGVPEAESHAKTLIGWTAGAGLEAKITPEWHVRAEYRYADYGTSGHSFFGNNNGGVDSFGGTSKLETHAVLIGVVYQFGAPAAAAAPAPLPPPPAPLPPPAPVAKAPEVQRAFQVFFDFDKSEITAAAAKVIQAASDSVRAGNLTRINVTGHTDTVGSAAYNQALSDRRAAAVKAQLVADGVPGTEITTIGVGKTGLLVPTADGVREPQNRRAEIVLQ